MSELLGYYEMQEIVIKTKENLELEEAFTIVKATGALLEVDGNQFCYISGQMPEPTCIVGFGSSPYHALMAFRSEFYNLKVNTLYNSVAIAKATAT